MARANCLNSAAISLIDALCLTISACSRSLLALHIESAYGDSIAPRRRARILVGRRDPTKENPVKKIEVVIPDELLREAVEAISEAARTGQIGNDKIFISPVEEVVRIRTGEHGEDAI